MSFQDGEYLLEQFALNIFDQRAVLIRYGDNCVFGKVVFIIVRVFFIVFIGGDILEDLFQLDSEHVVVSSYLPFGLLQKGLKRILNTFKVETVKHSAKALGHCLLLLLKILICEVITLSEGGLR